jgi:hypothetical protein
MSRVDMRNAGPSVCQNYGGFDRVIGGGKIREEVLCNDGTRIHISQPMSDVGTVILGAILVLLLVGGVFVVCFNQK